MLSINELFHPVDLTRQKRFGYMPRAATQKVFPTPKTSDRITDCDTGQDYIFIGKGTTGIWQLDKPYPFALTLGCSLR